MKIEYRQAVIEDAELLVNIYNASFYDDYVRYGSCPGYGQTKEMMEESIGKYLKHISAERTVSVTVDGRCW